MVKTETVFGAGQLPKFADNLYKDHEEDLYLVPTAEVPLTGLHMDEILDEASLPRRYMAYTPCFRREKMSAGRDVRGIKRGHQFDKVEMYIFCKPEESDEWLEKMRADAEETCAALGLTYRVKQLVHRQHRLRRGHHLRCRGLGARLRRMAGGLIDLERARLSGPTCERQVPHGRQGQGALRPHPERLGPGPAAHPDRRHGELPAGRRFHSSCRRFCGPGWAAWT